MVSTTPSDISASIMGSMGSWMPEMMRWMGYILIAVIIIGIMYAIYLFMQYKYKVLYVTMGKMDNGTSYVRGVKFTRASIQKEGGVDKIKLFMSKTSLPVNFDHIYPGNTILLFQNGINNFMPGNIHFSANPGAFIDVVPEDINLWAHVQSQQAIMDYQDQGFWAKNSGYFIMMGVIIFCLILVGAVIFMTYKYIGGELGNAASAAKSLGESMQQYANTKFAPN